MHGTSSSALKARSPALSSTKGLSFGIGTARFETAVRRDVRCFSTTTKGGSATDDGSHSDFAPQSKVNVNGQNEVLEFLDKAVKEHDVLLFMKGSPDAPQCGFSARVAGILKALEVDFSSADVLSNLDIREGIKLYSDWPTIPQLYVNGEFVGGCDIVSEMYENGELQELLKPIKEKQKKTSGNEE